MPCLRRAALGGCFLSSCTFSPKEQRDEPNIDRLIARRNWGPISETGAFIYEVKRPLQMICAGISAARHNRNACMSTVSAPEELIGGKSDGRFESAPIRLCSRDRMIRTKN